MQYLLRWAKAETYTLLLCGCAAGYLYACSLTQEDSWRSMLFLLTGITAITVVSKAAQDSIRRMIAWLLFMPLFIGLIVIAWLETSLQVLSNNFKMAVLFIGVATLVWGVAGYFFKKDPIKRAMSMLNAAIRYMVAFALVFNWYQYTAGTSISQIATGISMVPGSMLEMLVKIITLPYVLAGIAGPLAWEVRDWMEKKAELNNGAQNEE